MFEKPEFNTQPIEEMTNKGNDPANNLEYKKKFNLDSMRLPSIKKSDQIISTKREVTFEKFVIIYLKLYFLEKESTLSI